MLLKTVVNCVECDADIFGSTLFIGSDKDAAVNVSDFAQTEWVCPECGHMTCIGDIDMMDRNDV